MSAEGRIPVEDQIPWSGVKGKGLAQLLNDPQRRGIEADVAVKQNTPPMIDDDQGVIGAYSTRNVAKGMVNRSIAAMTCRWFSRNVFQCLILSWSGGRLGR